MRHEKKTARTCAKLDSNARVLNNTITVILHLDETTIYKVTIIIIDDFVTCVRAVPH